MQCAMQRVLAEQPELVEDDDVVLAEPLADERDLAGVLARVGVDAHALARAPAAPTSRSSSSVHDSTNRGAYA